MEHGFGHDLGAVRIHDGPVAAAAARSVGANAFTLGHHIVFDAGQYRPSQGEGRRLLAHELTHVMQQSGGAQPALQAQRSRFSREADTPSMGFTCTLQEMDDANFDGRSCCDERVLGQLRTMVNDARAHMRTAIERIDGGASIDALLQLHFGPSGPSSRASILANIRATLGVADAFLSRHTFLCRPLSDKFGCTGVEAARAAEDSDITVCLGGGTITFDWATILHEMFHVSGVADLHVYGETATAAEEAAGEFETYYAPQGAEMEDPQWRRYPSAAPLRNADSYRRLVEAVSADDFVDAQPSARFAPTLAAGFGFQLPDGSPTIMARVAFTPLGRGLHFITPGAVGFWSPTLGALPATDPGCHAGARLCRWRTRGSRGHGVGSRGRRVRSRCRRGRRMDAERSVDPAAMVRGSAGVRFGGPSFGGSVNADLMRIFDFALENQRTDGWILGLSGGLHWGGHSGAPR